MNQVDRVRDCLKALIGAKVARATAHQEASASRNVMSSWACKVKPDGQYYKTIELNAMKEYIEASNRVDIYQSLVDKCDSIVEVCETDYALELEILRSQRSLPTVSPSASVRRNRLSRLGRMGLK